MLGIFLLCQCASQHQTREFAPFFRTDPPGYLSPAHTYERIELESRSKLNLAEKKRLLDLYELEQNQLKKDSGRYAALGTAISILADGTSELRSRVEQSKQESSKSMSVESAEKDPWFQDAELKKQYSEVYKLWNQDENEQAFTRAVELGQDERFADKISARESFRLLSLRFRVALDLQNLEAAGEAYQAMRKVDHCALETAESGLLFAVHSLGQGHPEQAKRVFEEQCDPDQSPSNQVRRRYWKARFDEAMGSTDKSAWIRLADSRVPSFYAFLAAARLGSHMEMGPLSDFGYRKTTLSVSNSVHRDLTHAEQSLNSRLRNDAYAFLRSASKSFGSSSPVSDVPTMLYLAHLFQASGHQLEAMKVYSLVTEIALREETSPFAFDFFTEMFPTPHAVLVSNVAQAWGMDPDFLYSIMRQESAFNPGAVSSAGARGLMQLMPQLGAEIAKQWRYGSFFSTKSLFFSSENLKIAAYHLRQLQSALPHPALMAAAYNAGSKRVANWWKRGEQYPLDIFTETIPAAETRNYVKLVLRNYVSYKIIRGGGKFDPAFIPLNLPPLTTPVL